MISALLIPTEAAQAANDLQIPQQRRLDITEDGSERLLVTGAGVSES
jgi:hypothetical protein